MENINPSLDHELPASMVQSVDLPALVIGLLKGVLYRVDDEARWLALLNFQAQVRDYVLVLNLDLVLDEAEGYAYLQNRVLPAEESAAASPPRLISRRPLSFAVSLLIALLRKKLAEFDASAGDTRLVLSRDDIVELVRVFLPDGPNEARLIDQIESTINKVVELGFLQKLKPASGGVASPPSFEVKRIIKAFVDAQWLAEFDVRLATYQAQLSTAGNGKTGAQP